MRVYTCLLNGADLFTDASKVELHEDCLYLVTATRITRGADNFVLESANPSELEPDEEAGGLDEGTTTSGLDIVINSGFHSFDFSKADYRLYLKTFAKTLVEKWQELGMSESEITSAKERFMKGAKFILGKLNDCEFYLTSSQDPDANIPVLWYKPAGGDNPDEQPIFMFFKDAVNEEKV